MKSPTLTRGYQLVQSSEPEEFRQTPPTPRKKYLSLPWITYVLVGVGFFFGITIRQVFSYIGTVPNKTTCSEPATRREWRSLSKKQKIQYIEAVQCLSSLPSELGHDNSLYNDFPYTHSLKGNSSHGSPDFLPWHRYFLHIFEGRLRESCGYKGHLVYWDWTLDWEDLRTAPVWDSILGFGGDGSTNANRSVAFGHCVTDGPFANLSISYFDDTKRKHTHCLSRGFLSPEEARRFAPLSSPKFVERTLALSEYDEFFMKLEFDAHNAIPTFIRGDFYAVTAPNDPLFYLHHTQLDRLWWKWQQRSSEHRILKLSKHGFIEDMYNVIDMGELGPRMVVKDILDTLAGPLCYLY